MNIINGSLDVFIERVIHTRTDKTPHLLLNILFNHLLQLIDDIFAYFSTEYVKRRELIHKRVTDLSEQDNHPLSPVVDKVKNIIQGKEEKSNKAASETVLDKPKANDKKIMPRFPAEDKKTASHTNHLSKEADLDDQKKTLRELFDQGLHEDEILNIVADGMPQKEAQEILAKFKKEKLEKEHTKKVASDDEEKSKKDVLKLVPGNPKANEKKVAAPFAADDKNTSSQSVLAIQNTDLDDPKKTLRELFDQGLHEDEILNIVADGMPQQEAQEILAKLKKEKLEKDHPKKLVSDKEEKSKKNVSKIVSDKPKADEKKAAHQLTADDKNTSSQPILPIRNADLDDPKKTLRDLFEQGLQEDEILNIVADGMPQKEAQEMLTKLKEERKQKEHPKKAPPDIAKMEEKKAPQNQVKYPALVLAAHGVNQYQAGGPAACTPLACAFIASKLPVSSEMIEKLILNNTYDKDTFAETENCIGEAHLKVAQNPWAFQRDFGPTMQVSFERRGQTGLSAAVASLADEKNIDGAIITGNGVTIAMRKQGNTLEFFDSHGDAALTDKGNAAYVQTFTNDQKELAVGFLEHRFPNIGFAPNIEIWPIQS